MARQHGPNFMTWENRKDPVSALGNQIEGACASGPLNSFTPAC